MIQPVNVLFLCTGNSCRSIIGEAILNDRGNNNWKGWSAGSFPTGEVNLGAIDILEKNEVSTQGYYSKKWDVFQNNKNFDVVITVCDNAAGETCPYFGEKAIKCHWGLPDPAYQANKDKAFQITFNQLSERINKLLDLNVAALGIKEAQEKIQEIGDNS